MVVGVLGRGLYSFVRSDKQTSYRMMRYRVLFQGGVVLFLLFGVFFKPELGTGWGKVEQHALVDK